MSSPTRRLVGIDVGGTNIAAGAVLSTGEIVGRATTPFDNALGAEGLCDAMAGLARELEVEDALGIGVAGLIDHAGGRVEASPNLHAIEQIPLCAMLAERLGLARENVLLENDANVAALGEAWLGAGRDESHSMTVTLGTGIGGGIVLDGKLYSGPGGMAGEIGHVTVDPNGPLCGCGARGCDETLASGRNAQRRAREAGLPKESPGDIVRVTQMAREGDADSERLLRDIGRDLGRGLATAVSLLDIRCYVIGGGFGAALDCLEPGIREGLDERAFGERLKSIRLLPAELGSDAGWIGAARLGDQA